jgi:hypothetical protein
MTKDKFTAKAFDKCLEKLEYVIVACEFDETGNINDGLLNRLYVARELLYMTENELKQAGAI